MTEPAWWPDGDSDAERIPISALEHYAYCPRQAALIHVEGIFTDDHNTVRGHLAHGRVDKPGVRATAAPGVRQHYALPVWSRTLGLYGRCDVVEIGHGSVVPVEHKVGAYQPHGPADLQVAAQAVCLAEMLDTTVPYGEVFTHADRRRHRVAVTDDLLTAIRAAILGFRQMRTAARLPAPLANQRCRRCSLLDDCLPHALRRVDNPFQPENLGSWDA